MEGPSNSENKNVFPTEKLQQMKDQLKNFRSKGSKNFDFRVSILAVALVVLIGFILTMYKANEVKTRAFSVKFGNEEIGIVREKEEAIKIFDDIQEALTNTYNIDVVINGKLDFENTHAKDNELTSEMKMKENIKAKMTFLVSGYVLSVDGKDIGAFKTEKEAEDVLDKIKEPYEKINGENLNLKEIKFLEDVKVVKKEVPLANIKNSEEVFSIITKGTDEIKTHIVEDGENYWTIAKKCNMKVDDLIKANPGKDPEKVFPGDEVNLIVPKALITIATVEEVEYEEEIACEEKIEYNNSMYKNEKKVKNEGSPGKSKVLAKVEKHNGVEVGREIVKEEIVTKPVDRLIVKGTKAIPKTMATGAFVMPTRGSLSSRYGMRYGRMHKGIDIAAKTGTPIKAADGGTVTFSGYKGAYGYMVEINHGNGYVTRYGHCSKLGVKKGAKVYKGQTIAYVGSTGRTTGPHVHFEVIKNGVHQNPAKYLGR